MFKRTLIVEQNHAYIQQIIRMLKPLLNDVKYCCDGETALKMYYEFAPDLLLVEAILPQRDGFSILEEIIDDDLVKIVLTSINEDIIIKKAFELDADYIFVKPYQEDFFVERIKEVATFHHKNKKPSNKFDREEPFLRIKISNLLKSLGVSPSMKGYTYLREAIFIAYNDFNTVKSLKNRIYKQLAERFSTTTALIERNIRHAIETSVLRADDQTFFECFGYSVDAEKGKPTNGEFIASVADRLILLNKK